MTYRDIISDCRADLKMVNSEQLVSDRMILHEIISASNLIAEQALAKRKYWQSSSMFTPIPCLQMEQVPLSECCDYTSDVKIAKSLKKLPKIGESPMGLAIQSVVGLDNKKTFKQTDVNRYANLLKIPAVKKDNYYFIVDGYLYVTNPDTKSINAYIYFTELPSADLLFPGKDCGCTPSEDACTNPLDFIYRFVSGRIADVKTLVYKNLTETFLRLPQQVTSDNREGN